MKDGGWQRERAGRLAQGYWGACFMKDVDQSLVKHADLDKVWLDLV